MPRFDQMVKGGSKPEAEEAEGSADDWWSPDPMALSLQRGNCAAPNNWSFPHTGY